MAKLAIICFMNKTKMKNITISMAFFQIVCYDRTELDTVKQSKQWCG